MNIAEKKCHYWMCSQVKPEMCFIHPLHIHVKDTFILHDTLQSKNIYPLFHKKKKIEVLSKINKQATYEADT